MKQVFLAAALVAAVAGPVYAADLIEEAPIVTVEDDLFDWTGLYIGAQAAAVWGTVRIDDGYCVLTDDCGFPGSRYYSEPDLTGWELGGHVGYNHQFGTFVLGAESDINWSSVTGEAGYTYYDGDSGETGEGDPDEYANFDLLWEGSTRVKLGFAVDRFMPYITAGVAYGQAHVDTHREFGPDEDRRELDFSHPLNLIGYTVGLGASYAVTDDIFFTGEARYTQYGETRSGAQDDNDGETIIVTGPDLFSVRGGVSFRF